jgi:thymidylate synthase (FAD)
MYVKILEHSSLTPMLAAAAVCRDSTNSKRALNYSLNAGHDSLLEDWYACFHITGISRACSHQIVRHRIGWSFTQQSQRHTKIDDIDWYITPESVGPSFHTHMAVAKQGYEQAILDGLPLEDARYILPNATKTKMVVVVNARALQLFFQRRCCDRAQWEIRELAYEMLKLCQDVAPQLFGEYPNCKNCKEPCK